MNACRKVVLSMLLLAITAPVTAQDLNPARPGTMAEPSVVQGKRQTTPDIRPLDRIQSRIATRIQNRVPSRAGDITAPDLKGNPLPGVPR